MIDLRLYRLAFAPALAALVVLMFSLEGPPDALEPAAPAAGFEGERAGVLARQIATELPEREPGSAGDAAAADLVASRFAGIPAGNASEQVFETPYEGEDVEVRNVVLTLPGDSPATVVVLAARDAAAGPGAPASAAATGVLVELAEALSVAGHERTYVLASTGGAGAGAAGARELLAALPESQQVEAAVVISQPGAAEPAQPYVVTGSTTTDSASIGLQRSAARAVDEATGEPARGSGPFGQLARLAIPSGLGEQAPLIGEGIAAVAISSAGERPLPASRGGLDDLSGETLSAFGRAVQATVQALDTATEPLEPGPRSYVEAAGNLVPGWTLSVLALALLLPALLAALDAMARAHRVRAAPLAALGWAATRALPLLGALAALYALAFVGLVPHPPFPFDPGLYPLGWRAWLTALLLIAAAAATLLAIRPLRAAELGADGALAGAGTVCSLAGLGVWLANPYLGLLAVPAAHAWIVAGRRGAGRRGLTVLAVAASLLPLALAFAAVAAALELGAGAPWTFVLMLADGQLGLGTALALCFLAGSLAAAVRVAALDRSQSPV